MNFRAMEKRNDKQHYFNVKVESMFDSPFQDIVGSIPEEYVEEAVAENFHLLLSHMELNEFRYLKLYPSWKKMLCQNLTFVMEDLAKEDFKDFLEMFPEYSPEIYEFLFEEMAIYDDFSYPLDVVEDVLLPMAYLEKWGNCHFPMVHEIMDRAPYFLSAVATEHGYAKMWDVLYVLENEFDIPHEAFVDELYEMFQEFVDNFRLPPMTHARHNYSNHEMKRLSEFFRDREAYEFFRKSGLELYTLLIKLMGPYRDMMRLYAHCIEFHPDEVDAKVAIQDYFQEQDNCSCQRQEDLSAPVENEFSEK